MGSKKATTGGSHRAQTPPAPRPQAPLSPPASSWAGVGREGALQKGKPHSCLQSYNPTISHKELGAGGAGVHWLPCILHLPLPSSETPLRACESPPPPSPRSLSPGTPQLPRHPQLTAGVPQPAATPRSHQTTQEPREQRGLLWDPPGLVQGTTPRAVCPLPPLRRDRSHPALLCPSPAPSQPKGADTAGPFLLLAPSGQRAGVQKGPL